MATLMFGEAFSEATVMPLFGTIVDLRHGGTAYGSMYAISTFSFHLAMALGPIIAGRLTESFGFEVVVFTVGVAVILYSPLFAMLRNISGRYEQLQ